MATFKRLRFLSLSAIFAVVAFVALATTRALAAPAAYYTIPAPYLWETSSCPSIQAQHLLLYATNVNPLNVYQQSPCSQSYDWDPVIPVPVDVNSQVTWVSPTARVAFDFPIQLDDVNHSTGSYTYEVWIYGHVGGQDVTLAHATTKLYGQNATNVPPGGIKADANGMAFADFVVPVNFDAAVNRVTFRFRTPQTDIAQFQPPDLGPYNLAIVPLAAFQLPAQPIAILYAPVGNLGITANHPPTSNLVDSGNLPTLQLSHTVGSNVSFTQTRTIGTEQEYDDHVTQSGSVGAEFGDNSGNDATYTASASWEKTNKTSNEQSYGRTDSAVTSLDISQTYYSAPTFPRDTDGSLLDPISILAYGQYGLLGQPFLGDTFILATNTQYAIWDYPSFDSDGVQVPLIQPLGSSNLIIEVTVGTLAFQCAIPRVPLTYSYSVTVPGPNGAGTTQQKQVTLKPSECAKILSLDPFWVQKTMRPVLASQRFFSLGSQNYPSQQSLITVNQSFTGTQSTNGKLTTTLEVSSVTENEQGLNANLKIPLGTSGASVTGSASYSENISQTNTTTKTIEFEQVVDKTTQDEYNATTTLRDTCLPPQGSTASCSTTTVTAYLDLMFHGIAVTDNALPLPGGSSATKYNAALAKGAALLRNPCCVVGHGGDQSSTSRRVVAGRQGADGMQVICAICVPPPQGAAYVRQSGFGYVVVRQSSPAQIQARRSRLRDFYAQGLKRHISRPIPRPRPALAQRLTAGQMLAKIEKLRIAPKSRQMLVVMIQSHRPALKPLPAAPK